METALRLSADCGGRYLLAPGRAASAMAMSHAGTAAVMFQWMTFGLSIGNGCRAGD